MILTTSRNYIIFVLFLSLTIVSGCGGDGSMLEQTDESEVTAPEPWMGVEEGIVDGAIIDFIGDAFSGWAQSEFLTEIGLNSNPATAQQMNQVLSQLGVLQKEMVTVQQDLNTLIGDFLNLEAQMASDKFTTQSAYLGQILTGANINWNQFTNAVNCDPSTATTNGTCGETLPQIANDPQAIGALQELFTDAFFNSLAYETATMSNAGSASDPNNATIPDLLVSAKNMLVANINSSVAAQQNIVPLFDQYNNGLMNYYYYIINNLQQIYAIEQTLLYLKQSANLPQFANILLAEPGILNSNTYEQNYLALNNLYQTRITNLAKMFGAAIISDTGSGSPTPAKTLTSVPTGPWTSGTSCELYTWTGLLPSPQQGFEGSWNGKVLDALCFSVKSTITPSTACASGSQISVYQGTNAAGKTATQLQCTQLNPSAYKAPGWTKGAGFEYGGYWPEMATKMIMTLATPGFSTSATATPYITEISGPLKYSKSWTTDVAKLPGGGFTSLWQYNAPDGLVGAFAVLGEGTSEAWGIQLQILCLSGDQWCSQLPGTNPGGGGGTPGKGSSAICIGHQMLTLTCSDFDSATQALKYADESC